MKKIISCIIAVLLLSVGLCSCKKTESAEPFDADISVDTTRHKIYYVEIEIEDYGTVTVALDETVAPITVANFIKLVYDGFYDGLTFTRVQKGFVIQGGQSTVETDTIKGEFSANGVENALKHKKGVLSMARSDDYDSASSQFFIMLDDNSSLDGQYAAFGWVTKGMNIIENICNDIKTSDFIDNPVYMQMGFLKDSSQITITKMTLKIYFTTPSDKK